MQLHAQQKVKLEMHTCFIIAWRGAGVKKGKEESVEHAVKNKNVIALHVMTKHFA